MSSLPQNRRRLIFFFFSLSLITLPPSWTEAREACTLLGEEGRAKEPKARGRRSGQMRAKHLAASISSEPASQPSPAARTPHLLPREPPAAARLKEKSWVKSN